MAKTSSLYFSSTFTFCLTLSSFFSSTTSSETTVRFKIILRSVLPFIFFKIRFKNPFCSRSHKAVLIALSFKFNKLAMCKLLAVHFPFLEFIKLLISAKINFLVIFKSNFKI